MNLNDFYILVDTDKKIVIDKVQPLPENWNNIAGLPGLSDEELCDLGWAGHPDLGWISITSTLIQNYTSDRENFELNRNTLKKLVSDIRKNKETESVKCGDVVVYPDRDTQYSLFLKSSQAKERSDMVVNFKCASGYHALTSTQVVELFNAVDSHVQSCYDWESFMYAQIDNCNTISDFLNLKQ